MSPRLFCAAEVGHSDVILRLRRRRLRDAISLKVLNPIGQRLRAPAKRRVHRGSEPAQRLLAGYDAFSQGVLGEVGAQASHGVGEAAHAHTDKRALFCLAQVFVPALHFRLAAEG